MEREKQKIIILLLLIYNAVKSECPKAVLSGLPFVLEYALWRGWQQVIVYTPDLEPDCQWADIRLIKCLNVNGVSTTKNLYNAAVVTTKLGIVIICPKMYPKSDLKFQQFIKKLNDLNMNTQSYDWLIVARRKEDFKAINEVLNSTTIRFDQNLVVSYPASKQNLTKQRKFLFDLCDGNFNYKIKVDYYRYGYTDSNNKTKSKYEKNYYRSSDRLKNVSRHLSYHMSGKILPLYQTGIISYNYSKPFQMTNIRKLSLSGQFMRRNIANNYIRNNTLQDGRFLYQYFKVRINSTLYAYFLGLWSRNNSMSQTEIPYPVEARNFLREEIIIGRCNSTQDGALLVDNDGPSTPRLFDDVLYFLNARLHAKLISKNYTKLGFRSYEGTWTGLLGALMDNSVDIALEPVTAHSTRHNDMDFIFPLSETMSNIYIRHQETSTVRDIFLAPFSLRLIGCVVAVALFASTIVVIISRLTIFLQTTHRPMPYTEAFLWSTGILCQQGGSWTPLNPSGRILLLVCLLFALVTYNAYAAFITSVLSVRVASVDTVAAVLNSPDFKIGYIRNGADQMYLMSTKDEQLNEIYIRGYSEARNLVSSVEEGLARTANENYAFFAGQRAARITLRSFSQARGKCTVRELPVHSTRALLAFPLPRHSSYAKPILVSLLQLRSGGVLARLGATLVPDMPQCEAPSGFVSARATDVRSALVLLAVGLVAATVLGLMEYCWKNRQDQLVYLRKCCKRIFRITKT